MNKFAAYILMILIYLGVSRSFSLTEKGLIYIKNERVLTNFFSGAPLSIILVNETQTGFFIKTYYQKYKVIYGFQQPYHITVRTTRAFWQSNLKNIGMSLFRRYEKNFEESTIPMPPGFLFLGNRAYGRWVSHKSGSKVWRFHKAYRDYQGLNFPNYFGWKGFTPTEDFYEKGLLHIQEGTPFYGLNNEFGKDGAVTQSAFTDFFTKKPDNLFSWSSFFSDFFSLKPFQYSGPNHE